MDFITSNNLKYDPDFWPPESPDLNCIELVWHELKEFLRGEIKPKNKEELEAGIRQFWRDRMTIDKCRSYIQHVTKVVPLVEANNGGPTMK